MNLEVLMLWSFGGVGEGVFGYCKCCFVLCFCLNVCLKQRVLT